MEAAVLSIGKLGASRDQLEYYERQVAAGIEDYYAARGEAPGRWIGGGCGGLGVSGKVDREAFLALMDGRDPRSGDSLRPPHGRTRVAAFDLTFSAPKSVSVLLAIAEEGTSHALVVAHERAVGAALAYVEREACFTRRGKNGVRRVQGEGFVGAAYRHRLSRAGDPQLHTHVVVANMTGAEGRWTSLEAHGIYEHKSATGAIYRAVLRAGLRDRLPWISWRPAGRGLFEIEGVPPAVLREFSRRRVEIEERALALTGAPASGLSRERLEGIALATRRAKEYGVDGARWREEARARAAEHGLGEQELVSLQRATPAGAARSEADVVRALVDRLSGPNGLTANHNAFARRRVLAEAAGEAGQGASVAQLERLTSFYLEHESVVALGAVHGEASYTTRDLLAAEAEIVDGARRRAEERTAMVEPGLASEAMSRLRVDLSAEQAEAIRAVAGSGRGVDVIQALAGTGKTRTLGAIASCYRHIGYRIVGVAPTGRAARELSSAIDAPAFTLHRLVATLDRSGGFATATVVLFDEAAMAPTRQSAALFGWAQQAGAKVIAAGDAGQLTSVQAGGWFADVGRELAGPELRQVMRQRDPRERAALEALHDGDPDAYIEFKQAQRALAVNSSEQEGLVELLDQWDVARAAYGTAEAVMIARDNATRSLLNEQARARLKRDDTLALAGVVIAGREFCVGERVIARRNDRHRDVDNGTRGTVTAIDNKSRALTVTPDGGGRRELDADYAAEHLEHAYALTGHGAQGATLDWVGVIGRPSEFTAEWAYAALSRARGQTRMHVIAEPAARQAERQDYAPPERVSTLDEALHATRQAMRRRTAEPLALGQITLSSHQRSNPRPRGACPLPKSPMPVPNVPGPPRPPSPTGSPSPAAETASVEVEPSGDEPVSPALNPLPPSYRSRKGARRMPPITWTHPVPRASAKRGAIGAAAIRGAGREVLELSP
ncbi:MAG: MobF family relaxase [Solirubrobacteraceae bacterium]